ncbi:MAG: hydantoinase/oxoprolinase family protein [Rhodospirillales bacterium]|nr:5-oxoprolinase [Rhodospirillaceae bacterium]MDP6430489.1 hydantoinase/oxoprolinase family protein [Rhodospirillales bacterium]MDP6644970.1 hydantoinase/oxoprolinase family protein [Rhodospirillales bacterium]
MNILAVDIGGTFTDLMAFDDTSRKFYQAKSLSTPADLAQGIIDCIKKSGVDVSVAEEVIHGTTQAINTLIERKGAKTALLVTKGTRDVYTIGRGNRPESYNLMFHQHRPLVERRLTYEVDERILADGSIRDPLDREQAAELCAHLKDEDIDAVAVCFLHAYANPENEQAVGDILKEANADWYVSLSHEILREYREFERTSTTVVNAYIGPRMSGYVHNLEDRLQDIGFGGELSIMQSNGGVMTPGVAVQKPVTMMESGPVGGIIASAEIGRALGFENVISFDMGGTTAKTSLVRGGQPTMAEGYYVGGYASGDPVMAPVVDVVEVGAGGGSIAWIDEVGALKVGPQSSGADPGPICYRGGGAEPTITDANVILGRVGAADFLGGEMSLDLDGAVKGTKDKLANVLGMDVNAVASAIIDIAVTKMSLAVREVSVEKGYDPRDFALIASGGAGPLHAVAIARELHIPTVIVPLFPAHFSALGMLMADERQDFIQTYLANLGDIDFGELLSIHRDMRALAEQDLKLKDNMEVQIKLDLRYVGQEFTLSVPIDLAQIEAGDVAGIRKAYDDLHELRYAHHAADEPVEMVNYRLVATGKRPTLILPDVGSGGAEIIAAHRPVYFDDSASPVDCPVYDRRQLVSGYKISGPALIQEYASTTVMFAGDACEVTDTGELIITLGTSR